MKAIEGDERGSSTGQWNKRRRRAATPIPLRLDSSSTSTRSAGTTRRGALVLLVPARRRRDFGVGSVADRADVLPLASREGASFVPDVEVVAGLFGLVDRDSGRLVGREFSRRRRRRLTSSSSSSRRESRGFTTTGFGVGPDLGSLGSTSVKEREPRVLRHLGPEGDVEGENFGLQRLEEAIPDEVSVVQAFGSSMRTDQVA